jgi:antitoxin PrlF
LSVGEGAATPVVKNICTITAKGQTTVPKSIRQALGVGAGGRIAFRVEDGVVNVRTLEPDEDPALEPFLALLQADLAARPAQVGSFEALVGRWDRVVAGATADPDDAIEGEVAL